MASPFPSGRLAVLALVLAAGVVPVQAADESLAESLIRLRGEVEQLNGELEQLRQEQRTTLNGLAAQRAELEASVDRQQLAARELREKLAAKDVEASEAGAESDALQPAVLAAADALKAHIEAGLPFKQAERAADVDGFKNDLVSGAIPPARAVNRLWALYEDEFRLTRENGLFSQTISLGSERVLADVVRLGSMALYFKTQDGRVGLAQRSGEGWRFATAEDAADQARINALFDALRKQIRQGWFELPLAATGGAR
ncbi:MAG: DUF3450 family protein [Lysobacteraceae bacterium]